MASSSKKTKSNSALTSEELQEQEDKKNLLEASSNIEEIIKLISENHDRKSTHERVRKARDNLCVDIEGNISEKLQGRVFHPYNGKRVPLKLRNSRLLEIAEALELHIKTQSHGEDLQKALTNQITRKIKILEKQLQKLQE